MLHSPLASFLRGGDILAILVVLSLRAMAMRRWKLAGTLSRMRTPLFLRTATSLHSEENQLLVGGQDSGSRAAQRSFAAGRGVKRPAEEQQLVDYGRQRSVRRDYNLAV